MQKGNILIFLLIGMLILAGVAGGAYYLGTKKSSPAPIPTSTPFTTSQAPQPTVTPTATPNPVDETANWKTYTNSDSGFSFRYPNNWSTTTSGTSLIIAPQSIIADIKKISGGFGGGKGLVSALYINKEKIPTKSDEFQEVSSTQMAIDGKNATLHTITVTQESPLGEPGDQVVQVEIPFDTGFIKYELLDIKYRSIYDQILSTFKFQ